MGQREKKPFFKKPATLTILIAIFAFVLGYALKDSDDKPAAPQILPEASAVETEPLVDQFVKYVCSMNCVPPQDKPGNCPVCGMELIPIMAGAEENVDRPRVKLNADSVRRANIELAPVERKAVSAEIKMYGEIEYDPSHLSYITAFMPGVIDRVYVKRAGQAVRWHDPLFDLYSSDLYYTQQQLVDLMKTVPSFLAFQKGRPYIARDALVQNRNTSPNEKDRKPEEEEALKKLGAIRHKLRILGLPKTDIDELMKLGEPTGIATVYATKQGFVVEQNATEGTFVNTGTKIFTIGDPAYVWARLDAYESDFSWISKGQKTVFETDAYPGETFVGKVVYIDPVFDPVSRTFKVGVIYPDPQNKLRPNMLVRAKVLSELSDEGNVFTKKSSHGDLPLVIPATAPLITGKRAIVYVAVDGSEGVFEGREIKLGSRSRDYYIVRDGLEEGEKVVVNGNFKLDSAAQILAKSSMMNPPDVKIDKDRERNDNDRGLEVQPRAPERTGSGEKFGKTLQEYRDKYLGKRR